MVSVIIPTYNYGSFITEALTAVLNQTYADWECIVVDDCSTDNTASIVQSFIQRDGRFQYLKTISNAGVSAARNLGIRQAKGEWIQFLDADDLISSDKIEVQLQFLLANPKVDIVYSDFFHFTDHADFSSKGEYAIHERVNGSGHLVVPVLLRGNIFRMNTLLIRKNTMLESGLFREEFRSVEDWEFWLRILSRGAEIRFLPDVRAMSAVRVNPNGLSKDQSTMKKFYLPVLQTLLQSPAVALSLKPGIWMRYSFVFTDKIFRNEEKLILNKRKSLFIFLLILHLIVLFPFYIIYKLMRLLR